MKNKLEKYPKTNMYQIIDIMPVDHPFVITVNLVAYVSKEHGGKLTPAAIIDYEAKIGKPSCGAKGCNLWYKEHEQALVVEVSYPGKLQEAPGLQEYLESCKEQMEKDGMAGFIFIQKVVDDVQEPTQ